MKILKGFLLKLYAFGISASILSGCSSEEAINPTDCSSNGVNITSIDATLASCGLNDGVLTINASGGAGNYQYSIDGTSFQVANVFKNLHAGSYIVTVKDQNECSATLTKFIASDSGIEIMAEAISDSGCDTETGSIAIMAKSGQTPYEYKIEGGTYQNSNLISGLGSGDYTVFVKDSNGCEVSAEVVIFSGIKLNEHIIPIINNNCAVSGCHNGSSGIPDFSNKTNILNNAGNIMGRTGNKTMPPSASGRSLTDEEIALIACWINDGAMDN